MKINRFQQALVLVLCLGLLVSPAVGLAQQGQATPTAKVNLNTATIDQLQTLPGIGPVLAKNIVEFREKNGKFARIEEILNVKGMGEKKFQAIKDRLTV